MDKIIKAVNFLNIASALLTIILCVFPYGKFQNITLYVLFISYGLEFILEKKWKTFQWTRYSWMYTAFLTFFMMILLWMPFEEHTDYTAKIIEYRLPFLAFGIMGLFGLNNLHKLKYYSITFVLWAVIMIFYIMFFKMGFYYLSYDGTGLIPFGKYNPFGFMNMVNDIKPSQYFASVRTICFTSHFIFDFILNLGIISCVYLFLRNPFKHKVVRTASYVLIAIAWIIILATLLISDGRSGMIASVMTTGIGVIYLLWKKSRITTIIAAIIIAIAGLYFISGHQKIKDSNINKDPRTIVWRHSLKLIKEKPILGYGAGDASYTIMDELSTSQDVLDTHDQTLLENLGTRRIICAHSLSQILQTTLEYGVFGLSIILIIIFCPFFIVKKKDHKCLALMFIIVTFIQLATDVYVSTVPLLPYSLFILTLLREDKINFEKEENLIEETNQ